MMSPRKVLAAAIGAAVCAVCAPTPIAAAKVGLMPGTPLYFRGGGKCSLGFLATNADGDRLGVTAGHCSADVDQEVVSEDGTPIGEVVHRTPDNLPASQYGVTLIHLYNTTYTSDAYFTTYGNPAVGDYVKKYGARTAKTEGKIVSISTDPANPGHSEMTATLVGLPGDSGSAWVGTGDDRRPQLLGLNIGYTTRPDGGYGDAIGFPIRNLIALVKQNSPVWGPGFIPVGP